MLPIEAIPKAIEHTLLKPDATERDIQLLCNEAEEFGFFGVCVNPVYVTLAKHFLEKKAVKVITVVGFPLGSSDSKTKAYECALAVEAGADEIDMVIQIGALKDGRLQFVAEDIEQVVKSAGHKLVKVIVETGLLTMEEKRQAVEVVAKSGARFVKTCTGFAKGQAEVEDIKLFREIVGPEFGIKASGGIRTSEGAIALLEAGATRLGTSSGPLLLKGKDASSTTY